MTRAGDNMRLGRSLGTLDDTAFDVAIIGGGITGACLAHDAALRGAVGGSDRTW